MAKKHKIRKVIFEKSGHNPMLEETDMYYDLISEFT